MIDKERETTTAPSSSNIGGSFTCRPEHAVVCRNICDQLGGGLSTNPDGSVTCSFTLPESTGGASRVPGSFSINKSDVVQGEAICNQLGGKIIDNKSGAKCEFFLPQEPRWSMCPLSNNAGIIRFDTDTFYITAATSNGVILKVFQGGSELEESSLIFLRSDNGARVDAKGTDGSTSTLQFSTKDGSVSIRYSYRNHIIFELEEPLTLAEKAFAAHYARNSESHPHLPYLQLLLDEMRRNPSFHEQVLNLIGFDAGSSAEPGVISFCAFACRVCLLSLEPHACVAWAFCTGATGFFKAPS